MKPFVIDCDTGRDDALTLWLAIAEQLPLVGVVTSYGNTGIDNVIDNTARVLSLAGANHIPLIKGNGAPSSPHPLYERVVLPRQGASGNGLCNLSLPTASRSNASQNDDYLSAILALAKEHGPLDYFIIGPATNFAQLIGELGDRLANVIASVTMLGGKFDPLWQTIPGADFNIACDPAAVDQVLHCARPVRFVPLNATWPIVLSLNEVEALVPQNSVSTWAKDLMVAHCRHFAPEPVFRFHDPSVLVAARRPDLFHDTRLIINLDKTTEDFGRLTENTNGMPCQIGKTASHDHAAILSHILGKLGFDAR